MPADIDLEFFHALTPLEMMVLDKHYNLRYANPVLKQTISNPEPENKPVDSLFYPENKHKIYSILQKAQENNQTNQLRCRVLKDIKDEFFLIVQFNQKNEEFYIILSKQQTSKQNLELDSLTGLPNRESFIFKAEEQLLNAQNNNYKLAILFVDLNNFKPINDNFGHKAGDTALKEVAKRLSSSLRDMDIVSRFGGDEFVIALNNIKEGIHTSLSAKRILGKIEEPITLDNKNQGRLSASIGIAIYPDNDDNILGLIKKADEAMYWAKKFKYGYSFFDLNKIKT